METQASRLMLYLDIDGVLIPDYYNSPPPYTIANLNVLLSTFDPLIVLSSDWRYHGLEYMNALFREWRISSPIWDTTTLTQNYVLLRGREIEEHKKKFPSLPCLILDDLNEGMDKLSPFLVQCDSSLGLTEEKLKEAIRRIR